MLVGEECIMLFLGVFLLYCVVLVGLVMVIAVSYFNVGAVFQFVVVDGVDEGVVIMTGM